MSVESKLTKQMAVREFWNRADLRWKLDSGQKELYDLYYSGKHKNMTWLLARRSGKSFCLTVLAIEQCLRKPNSVVKFLAPTRTQIDNVLRPIFKKILSDCPTEVAPNYVGRQYIYYFKNGSEIQLAGTDNGHAEKLRGGDSDMWIIDEAGSCDNLANIISDILVPTTLITKGKGILASTPPKDPEHDFIKFVERAEKAGSLIKKTVFENPRITLQDIKELTEELGGENSDAYKREMLCQILRDTSIFVLPEFTEELEKEVVRDWPRPPFYDGYEGMDLGGKDLTVVLFGYYDFRAAKYIIEDEIVMDFRQKGNHLQKLTQEIMDKEEDLYTNIYTNEIKTPHARVSDIDYIVTNEIYTLSKGKLQFDPAKKDDADSAINNLRMLLANKKIIINPRCKTLIQHLRNVKWAKSKKTFARSEDDGHYDAVDALKYLVRHVNTNKNPYPAHYDLNTRDTYFNGDKKTVINNLGKTTQQFQQLQVYNTIFNLRNRNKK